MTGDAVPRRAVTRREVLKFASAGTLVSALSACAGTSSAAKSVGKVVVIGGGFGGATAAKHLRLWSGGNVAVTLVEPNWQFVSCPISNLVLGGSRTLADITVGYQGLRKWGVNVVHDTVASIDRREAAGSSRVRHDLGVRPPGRLAGRRFHVRPCAGDERRGDEPHSSCLEGRRANGVVASPARSDAGRRRRRDERAAGALPLSAGTVRARMPDRLVPEDQQAEEQADRARCESAGDLEGRAVHARLEGGLRDRSSTIAPTRRSPKWTSRPGPSSSRPASA